MVGRALRLDTTCHLHPCTLDPLHPCTLPLQSLYPALMRRDNAGSDVLLGMLPLAREFIKSGSQVCLWSAEAKQRGLAQGHIL